MHTLHTLQAAPASAEALLSLAAAAVFLEAADGEGADAAGQKLPAFDMEVYTGGPIRPKTTPPLDLPVVVDLATLDLSAEGRPVLKDHNSTMHVGHIAALSTDGQKLTGRAVASGAGMAQREVVAAARNGFKWQVSFGLAYPPPELVPAGRTLNINGRMQAGPFYLVRNARVREISLLTLGADDNTSARIAAQAAERAAMNFSQWLASKGFSLEALSDQQKQSLEAAFNAEQALAAGSTTGGSTSTPPNPPNSPSPAPVAAHTVGGALAAADAGDPIIAMRQRLASERARQTQISGLLDRYRGQVVPDQFGRIEASAINEGWDANRLELELLRNARPQGVAGAVAGNTGRNVGVHRHGQLAAAVLVASLMIQGGLNEEAVAKTVPSAQREQVMNAALEADMRGYGLHGLMDATIHASGGYYGGSRKSNGYLRAALEADRQIRQAGSLDASTGFSTISLSGVLSNVANKSLLAAYTAVSVKWNQIAAIRSHSDFKTNTRYRLDSSGAFKKVAADGELKHIQLTDAAFTNRLETFGCIIALTRQMQINDDLGAFLEIPTLIGRMGALRLEEAVFVLLLANTGSFYGTGNRNFMTGGASALSITSLTTAEQMFRDQVEGNGKPVLIDPDRILVGSALSVTAQKLFADTSTIATGIPTAAAARTPSNNEHVGKFRPVASPYVNNTSIRDQDGKAISNQSATAWALFADPAVRAAIGVAFLNGQQTPTIENAETDFNTLGMQWRAYHDFGVGYEDPRAVVWSAGA